MNEEKKITVDIGLAVTQLQENPELADMMNELIGAPLMGQLEAENEHLRSIISQCETQFNYYAENHRKKGTDEGRQKANTNINFALMCRDALTNPVKPK